MITNNDNYWYTNISKEELLKIIERNIDFSREIFEECQKYDLRYYDTGKNRESIIQSIYEELING